MTSGAGGVATALVTGERPPDSPENPGAGQGSVLLDIGGDVGALVVEMPVELTGSEVEVLGEGEQPSGPHAGHDHGHDHGHGHGHGHPRHVAVVRRPIVGGEVPTLVYPDLVEGHYRLVPKGSTTVVLEVDVRGGEVTSADWPGGAGA